MPTCHACGTRYVRSYRWCPICNHPEPVHSRRAIAETFSLPAVGQTFDGQTIIAVHLTGSAGLELTLADGSMVDFASWRECVPVSSLASVAQPEAA